MEIVQSVLWLMAACVGLAVVARALRLPYAVVLILTGSALAFAPGVPQVALDPELALAFFLPPLLMASAYRTDWHAFRRNLRPILLLAVGFVAFSTFAIAALARWLVPEIPWAAALALGAILAPPDAVAAVAGAGLKPMPALGSFLLPGLGGVVVGWVLARAVLWAVMRLHDTLLETAMSFLATYAAFLLAEELHLSGVMATVTCGIVIGRASHTALSARTRLEARAVWDFMEFVLTSLVFILIGLQLNAILRDLHGRGGWELAGLAAAVSLALIAIRFLWVFPATYLPRLLPALRRHHPFPPWREVFVMAWAGMRGVVSLAAALSLPAGFPERDLIVFLAFCAIMATLVLQGTTLEWLVRRLGLVRPSHPDEVPAEEAEARHAAAQAMLEAMEHRAQDVLYGPMARDMLAEFRERAGYRHRVTKGGGPARAERAARRALRLEALDAARVVILARHAAGNLPEEVLAKLAQELDLEEARLKRALG